MQAAAHFPVPRVQQPLPESAFVVAAREELDRSARMTTVQSRASLSSRGRATAPQEERGRANAPQAVRGRGRGQGDQAVRGRGRGQGGQAIRGRGKGSKRETTDDATTSQPARGRGRGKKPAAHQQTHEEEDEASASNARNRRRGYKTGAGSMYHMLFGDDQNRAAVPDLNELAPDQEEIQVTQTAPE